MTWNEAIDYALKCELFIPNYALCKKHIILNCWTSTTDSYETFKALVLGEPEPVDKSEKRLVVMTTDYTLKTK